MLPNWKHDELRDLLEMHLAGENITPSERESLFDHIEHCEECRRVLEAEERLSARMKSIPKLVAPADLRAKILQGAMKDFRERSTTIANDPVINPMLQQSGEVAVQNPNRNTVYSDFDDMPVFDGIETPRKSPFSLLWKKSSPVLATGFVSIAALAALYTGSFDRIPGISQLQAVVRFGVDQVIVPNGKIGNQPTEQAPDVPVTDLSGTVVVAGFSPTGLLPGTEQLAGSLQGMSSWFSKLENSVVYLAKATETKIPGPAENSDAQITAIVLRPTLNDTQRGGFEESRVVAALKETADMKLGAAIEQQDQFVIDGRRYRTFLVELSQDSAQSILENLREYRTAIDSEVLKLIDDQNKNHQMTGSESVACFSGEESGLCKALSEIAVNENGGSFSKKKIRLIVME